MESSNNRATSFVGATINNALKNTIREILQPYPIQLISTNDASNNAQKSYKVISPNICHQFIAVSSDASETKPFIVSELIKTIRSDMKQKKVFNPAVLIFLSKDTSPIRFAEKLSEFDIKSALLHEYINDKTLRSKFLKLFKNGSIDAVIASESVCRGLDFIWLDHIICAEMPLTDTTYLHISGRCSRLHSKGFVTSIVDEFEEDRLKRFAFKYQIELGELDQTSTIESVLRKQRRKYNKLNTFPLLLQNREYLKQLKQQLYLTSSSSSDNKDSINDRNTSVDFGDDVLA